MTRILRIPLESFGLPLKVSRSALNAREATDGRGDCAAACMQYEKKQTFRGNKHRPCKVRDAAYSVRHKPRSAKRSQLQRLLSVFDFPLPPYRSDHTARFLDTSPSSYNLSQPRVHIAMLMALRPTGGLRFPFSKGKTTVPE